MTIAIPAARAIDAERHAWRRRTSTSAAVPVGIAYATAVSGRVMAHHATSVDSRTSHRVRGSSRQRSRAHQPPTHVAAVVICEKYDGRNPSGTGANVQSNHASSAACALVSRLVIENTRPAVIPVNATG